MYKIFYFKNKFFDFHIKMLFIDIKLYLGSFISFISSLLKPYNYISLVRLCKKNYPNNILITEINQIHSEIFPSWLFYLKKMNFKGEIIFWRLAQFTNQDLLICFQKRKIMDISYTK